MPAVLDLDVCAAQNRGPVAFGRLVDASKNVVASIAFAILRDPAVSEEIAQDVYLEVWNGIGTLRNAPVFFRGFVSSREIARTNVYARARVTESDMLRGRATPRRSPLR